MPPRTRGAKSTKTLKENLVVVNKTKSKPIGKITKPLRKALADKTNSASDDNNSIEIKKTNNQNHATTELQNMPRPRRERRLPTRYVDNNVLNNLSNSKVEENKSEYKSRKHLSPVKAISPVKVITVVESPFKTPQKNHENSLVANRPKRICRLPSKFEDHSISPSKYIPVKPCHASTPILENKTSKIIENVAISNERKLESSKSKDILSKKLPTKRHMENSPEASSDTNNNAKRRLLRQKKNQQDKTSSKDNLPPKNIVKSPKKGTKKNFSFRVLEDKKLSQSKENNLDVYEFTYDPNEEPPPAKKKRKKTVKKKPTQPKTVVFKNNYDRNVAKALEALKNVVAKKPDVPKVVITPTENVGSKVAQTQTNVVNQYIEQKLQQNYTEIPKRPVQIEKNMETVSKPEPELTTHHIEEPNYNSVRVEDIAADFEISAQDYNDINYSPVTSPQRPKTPIGDTNDTLERSVHNNDPLNLRGDLSFFDDNPVASSSINMSTRHPQASPWRVEFNNLPIRWHVNSYVKPNMTPAVESSFINFEDNKKKHVYTNMIGHEESGPEIVPNQSNLKQTSIISFIREVVEKSAQKKKRGRSVTPTKANLFDDLSTVTSSMNDKTPKKLVKTDKNTKQAEENVGNTNVDAHEDKENSNEISEKKRKKSQSGVDKDGTFFGFDESEDQENVSPVKVDNPKVRALRPRARAVLQEINAMTGPMRALPLAAKSKFAMSSDAVNKVYEEMKSAADAPVFPDKGPVQKGSEVTAIDDMDEDSNSVHLFEDIELVHHLKPTRKSYGKAKKVTFRQHSSSSDSQNEQERHQVSSDEDDLTDLTFTMPCFQPQKNTKKKKKKKQKMSKKEQKAMDEWAAGFNSMCEDIEEVPLNVE